VAKTQDVILRRKVDELGDVGDVVSVKRGYARNYLLPQGLAYAATEQNRRRLEQESRIPRRHPGPACQTQGQAESRVGRARGSALDPGPAS